MFRLDINIPSLFRYPFHLNDKLDDSRVFVPLFVHQYICASAFNITYFATNSFLFAVMVFHNFQIKLLGHRLKTLGCSKLAVSHEVEQSNDYSNLISLLKMHNEIKQ